MIRLAGIARFLEKYKTTLAVFIQLWFFLHQEAAWWHIIKPQ